MGPQSEENPRFSPKNRLPPEDAGEFAKATLPPCPSTTVFESAEPAPFVYHAYLPRVSDPPAQRFVEHFSPQRLGRSPHAQYFFHELNEQIHEACRLTPVVLNGRSRRPALQNIISHSDLFSITIPEDTERKPHVGVLYQFSVWVKDKMFSFIPDLDGIRWGSQSLLRPTVITPDPLLILAHSPLSDFDSSSPRVYFREILSRQALDSMIPGFNKWTDKNLDSLLESPRSRSNHHYPYQLLASIMRPTIENAIQRTFEIHRSEYDYLRSSGEMSIMGASISPSKRNFPATVLIERSDRLKNDGISAELYQFDFSLSYTPSGKITCESLAPGAEIDNSDTCR